MEFQVGWIEVDPRANRYDDVNDDDLQVTLLRQKAALGVSYFVFISLITSRNV